MNFSKFTPYFQNKIINLKKDDLPFSLKKKMIKEASQLSKLGINSEKEHKDYFFIKIHGTSIVKELSKKNLSSKELENVLFETYSRKNDSINSIFNLYCSIAEILINYKIPLKKISYPNTIIEEKADFPYDLNKWVTALGKYYDFINNGYDLNYSLEESTFGWEHMEKQDFKQWVKFYQEGGGTAYKTAQFIPSGKAILPVENLKGKIPGASISGQFNPIKEEDIPDPAEFKRRQTEIVFKSIISRLNAAEKLATRPEIQPILQRILNKGLPDWLKALHELKREIQTAPLRSIAKLQISNDKEMNHEAMDALLSDLFIKESFVFEKENKKEASSFMLKLSQSIAPPPAPESNISGEEAMNEFIQGMNQDFDSSDVEDELYVEEDETPNAAIEIIAQIVPTNPNKNLPPEIPRPKTQENNLPSNLSQDPFEQALSQVSVKDVVIKLDAIANVLRNREISRQLAIIDLWMSQLGIASFFPSLAEASSKTLESNQYALTRIEDILSKLRGSLKIPEEHQIDIEGTSPPIPTQPVIDVPAQVVQQNLGQEIAAEQAKKEKKKELEEAKQDSALQNYPITDVSQELSQPAKVQPNVIR